MKSTPLSWQMSVKRNGLGSFEMLDVVSARAKNTACRENPWCGRPATDRGSSGLTCAALGGWSPSRFAGPGAHPQRTAASDGQTNHRAQPRPRRRMHGMNRDSQSVRVGRCDAIGLAHTGQTLVACGAPLHSHAIICGSPGVPARRGSDCVSEVSRR